MDEYDDPYALLGVTPEATEQEIRSAYRKAALRHHPDKQRTEEDRQSAHVIFAKIGNAYEILSDPDKRREFDQYGHGGAASFPANTAPNEYAPHDDHHQQFHDFFHSSFHRAHPFHDPFEIFERVFREEFGGPRRSNQGSSQSFFGGGAHPFAGFGGGGLFQDPFFGAGGGMMDPFGGRGSMFGRGGGDPVGDIFSSLRQVQQQQQEQNGFQNNHNHGQSFYFSSSSTSFGSGLNGGQSVTTQTTTRMINGKQQTVTERIIRKADGTVERHVEKQGDDDEIMFPPRALPAEQSPTQSPSGPRRFLSWGGGNQPRQNSRNNNHSAPRGGEVVEVLEDDEDEGVETLNRPPETPSTHKRKRRPSERKA